MFIIYKKPNGRTELLESNGDLSLPVIQKLVDGYVRVMSVGKYIVGFNEDGEPLGLEPNCEVGGETLVGSIFICKTGDSNLLPLSIEEVRDAIKLIKPLKIVGPKAYGYLTIDFNNFTCEWDSHPPESRRENCEYMYLDLRSSDALSGLVSAWRDKEKIMDYLTAEYRFEELKYKF